MLLEVWQGTGKDANKGLSCAVCWVILILRYNLQCVMKNRLVFVFLLPVFVVVRKGMADPGCTSSSSSFSTGAFSLPHHVSLSWMVFWIASLEVRDFSACYCFKLIFCKPLTSRAFSAEAQSKCAMCKHSTSFLAWSKPKCLQFETGIIASQACPLKCLLWYCWKWKYT